MEKFLSIISFFLLIFSFNYSKEIENKEITQEKIFSQPSIQEYVIYEESKDNTTVKLIKRITKIDDSTTIKYYLTVNNDKEKEVKFENIGNFYNVDNKTIICPKGKFHPIDYNNNNLIEIIPESFNITGDWNLKCNLDDEGKIDIYYEKCGENCKTKDEDGCKCLDCFDGFYLDDYDCKKCDSNCKTCITTSTTCASCNETHFLDKDNKCSLCNPNCKTCITTSTTCTSCYDSFFLDNNKCSNCDSRCKKCQGKANICTECNDNMFLYDNECLDCATNCYYYDADSCRCSTCGKGFEKIKYQCINCVKTDPPCSEYEENKCTCKQCFQGSYLDQNTKLCEYCDTNCKSCEETASKCTDCEENYFLEGNRCFECTECNETEAYSCRCSSCKDGKYKENWQCKPCKKECKTCSEENVCQSCIDGYYFYFFNCKPCYELCQTCSAGPENNKKQFCDTCKPNYVFLDGNCLEKCPEGYYEKGEKCELCNPLCKTSGENCNSCESCFEGYYLVKDEYRCEKCNEHCETCSSGVSGDNQNCETCNITSEYKFFVNATGFGKNCVQSCPNGTVLEGNYTCVLKKQENPENRSDNKQKTFIIILSVIGGLLVIGIVVYLVIYCLKRKKKLKSDNNQCDDKLINEINKDLNLYQSFT